MRIVSEYEPHSYGLHVHGPCACVCIRAQVRIVSEYEPHSYGLDVPEALLMEVYIYKADVSPVVGWETGRESEPAFLDMNLHACIRTYIRTYICTYVHR